MRRDPEQLSPGEWAVLALLAEAPAHGFALARALGPDGEVGHIWALPRPLVYRALDRLANVGLAAEIGTVPSETGPQRRVLEATPEGGRRVADWLPEPVEHVRDGRSLLMLKLLFLDRRHADPGPLLAAQRQRFGELAVRLEARMHVTAGFERTLILWRLENTSAAIRFVDRLLTAASAT